MRAMWKIAKKRWVVIAGIGVLVIGGGTYAYQHFKSKPANVQVISGKVKKGDVKEVITATGTASYAQMVPLSFEQNGKVTAIFVNTGDEVKAGQPLAQLDTADLEKAVEQAQTNLVSAQAKYQQTIEDLKLKAKTDLVNAQQALLIAKQNADSNYLQNQVYLAEQAYKAASDALAAAQSSGASNIQQLQSSLSQAQTALTNAKNALNGGAAQDLAVAQDKYNSAVTENNQVNQGKSSEFLAAKASLVQSQTQLETAKDNLAKATLKAPIDGTVISADLQLYQNVGNSGNPVMTLAGNSRALQVKAAVDQADIGRVKAGQKVDMNIDSAPDNNFVGTVTNVSLLGTTVQNVTTYEVTINVDEPTDILRDGMSVNAAIVIDEAKDVLTVPSQAVMTRGNQHFVLVPGTAAGGTMPGRERRNGQSSSSEQSSSQKGNWADSGSMQRPNSAAAGSGNSFLSQVNAHYVPVEVGLDDGANSEIKSGLTEGQDIIVQVTQPSVTPAAGGSRSLGGGQNPMRSLGSFRSR